MKEFKGKVAVITGAASGIGRAIAERCAREGMKVVLADIEEEALSQAEEEMKAEGATVLAALTDVSKAGDVEALAQKTLDTFGAVHLLCNNAGVLPGRDFLWERTLNDWEWVLGVNLWGVIHGTRVFVPVMLEQGTECHIVNTASAAGLLSIPYLGIYNVTKHAVVALTETLHRELRLRGAKLEVSVLCPAWVNTRIRDSGRNRSAELWDTPVKKVWEPDVETLDWGTYLATLYDKYDAAIRPQLQAVLEPAQVAELVIHAVAQGRFYIFTHPAWKRWFKHRLEDIVEEQIPDLFL